MSVHTSPSTSNFPDFVILSKIYKLHTSWLGHPMVQRVAYVGPGLFNSKAITFIVDGSLSNYQLSHPSQLFTFIVYGSWSKLPTFTYITIIHICCWWFIIKIPTFTSSTHSSNITRLQQFQILQVWHDVKIISFFLFFFSNPFLEKISNFIFGEIS